MCKGCASLTFELNSLSLLPSRINNTSQSCNEMPVIHYGTLRIVDDDAVTVKSAITTTTII